VVVATAWGATVAEATDGAPRLRSPSVVVADRIARRSGRDGDMVGLSVSEGLKLSQTV
jgi:hypothetical protein